jgi:hypothetical protein
MEYTITCSGSPIGVADLAPLAGLVHAPVRPASGYAAVRDHARRAAAHLGHRRRLWPAVKGDFAEEFARTWGGGRLALVDGLGNEIAVASVMVIDRAGPGIRLGPHVIVDARPDMARVEAFRLTIDGDGGGRSRPAA